MNKFICLLILSFVLFGCSPSEVDYNLIQDRNGIAYLPNESEPFTGTAVASYPSGQQQIVVSYENGKPSGISSEWYANGQMKTEQHFSGEDEGRVRDWYENGEVARDIRVLDGTLVGRNIWKFPEFEGEINALNGFLHGVVSNVTANGSEEVKFKQGLVTQRKYSSDVDGVKVTREENFEFRQENTEIRYQSLKYKSDLKTDYFHIIDESALENADSEITSTRYWKNEGEEEFDITTSTEINKWEKTDPVKILVSPDQKKFSVVDSASLEYRSLKTGNRIERSWQSNDKLVASFKYDQGILNGWVFQFDREKATWDEDRYCYIAGSSQADDFKCEITFGKSVIPNDIPEPFRKTIVDDENKVAKALIKKTKAEKERKRKAEIEKKKQEEAEKKRRIKAEKKRKAEEEQQRIINAKKTEERLALELERFKKELMSNDQMCVDKASYSETLFGLATVSDSCNDAIQSAFDIYKNGDQSLAISAINDIQNDSRICKRDYEKCLLEKNKKAMELSLDTSQFNKDSDVTPVYVAQPQYPRRAQTRGKQGYAVVEVTITSTGGVRDPRLLEEYPEGWGFGGAALKAADKLRYVPKIVNGVTQETKNVRYKYTFRMAQ